MTVHPWKECLEAAAAFVETARPAGDQGDVPFRRDDAGRLVSSAPLRWGGRGGGIAAGLAAAGPPPGFLDALDDGGAIALRPDPAAWGGRLLAHLCGEGPLPAAPATGLTWLVEHSQPNTHKAFHVGHFRNVVTGDFVARLGRRAGHEVVAANYIGDIGTHVLRALLGWERAGRPDPPPGEDRSSWLGGMYADWAREEGRARDAFVEAAWRAGDAEALAGEDLPLDRVSGDRRLVARLLEAAEGGGLSPEARAAAAEWRDKLDLQNEVAARWAAGDEGLVADWERTRGWCLEAFDRVYALLGVEFDRVWYESELEEEARATAEGLVSRGIAKVDEGAVIVDFREPPLDAPKLGVLPLTRSDGLPLYSAKDLALAEVKAREVAPDVSLYVVASPQSHYFRQVFAILSEAGHGADLRHLAYELVDLPEGQMSSRRGTIVAFGELWEEARRRVAARSRDPEGPDVDRIAAGALKHAMLARDLNRRFTFDWDEVLSVEGRTGPYLQYAGVRAKRILEQQAAPPAAEPPAEVAPQEEALLFQLLCFPEAMERAVAAVSPVPLVDALHRVARAFSDFYHSCPVLKAEESVRPWRLALTRATGATLERGLAVLGIEVPEEM